MEKGFVAFEKLDTGNSLLLLKNSRYDTDWLLTKPEDMTSKVNK